MTTNRRLSLLYALASLVWVLAPVVVYAAGAGLVPCGVGSDPSVATECQACNVAQLIQSLITWAIGISIPIAMVLFAYAGALYASSGGSGERVSKAHSIFATAGVGFIIVLTGWLVINTILFVLLKGGPYGNGNWFTISCVSDSSRARSSLVGDAFNKIFQPGAGGTTGTVSGGTVSSGGTVTSGGGSGTSGNALQTAAANSQAYAAQLQEACAKQGLSTSDCQNLQGILAVESGGGVNGTCNGTGACGIMQMLPETACTVSGGSLAGCNGSSVSDRAAVQQALQDAGTSIDLAAAYYKQQLVATGDSVNAIAAYNGGSGAVAASQDCPGSLAYQCQYDSLSASTGQACNGTTITDCSANTGYVETRNYVNNVQIAKGYLTQ